MQTATSRTNHRPSTRLLAPSLLTPAQGVSPLMLSDRLITLAEDADRAGHTGTAKALIGLAHSVLDHEPLQ